MKKLYLTLLVLLPISTFAQAQSIKYITHKKSEFRYLQLKDHTQIQVVYFPETKEYFKCDGNVVPRSKLGEGEVILPKVCDCSGKNGIVYIGLAMTKEVSHQEFESLIRMADPRAIKTSGTRITLTPNEDGDELVVSTESDALAYVNTYTKQYKDFKLNTDAPKYAATAPYSNIIRFDYDSAILPISSYPALDAAAADLRSSSVVIQLEGYASSEGTAAHSLNLSKDRANSVKMYLINSGIDAKRIKVKGYGETNPIASNDTEEGRTLNRRVEIKRGD